MEKDIFKTLKIKETTEELGAPLQIEGEYYYYSVMWQDLKEEQQRQGLSGGDDVRAAGYVLGQLGILANQVYVDVDDKGEWVVYWG